MASNKAATATFIAAFAMIFAVEVSVGQETIGNSDGGDDAVRHYKVNGFDFEMEKGHEACYIACYNNVFATNSSPFTAEKRCHKKCSSSAGGSLVSASSAVAAAKHTLNPNRGIFYTGGAAKKPRVSSAGTGAAAEKSAVSSAGAAAEAPAVPSAGAAAEKPAISSAGTAAEAPVVSSAGAAAEAPVVSSASAAAEGPAVWSAGTEETNFGNPYS
nr:LPXTG cell wall anchor domain-containing protein [Ipomoea batatas]